MMEINMNRFVDNVRFLCKEKNIELGCLEKNVGIQRGYLSKLRKGNYMRLDVAYNISKILETSLEELIESNIELKKTIEIKQEELKELFALMNTVGK